MSSRWKTEEHRDANSPLYEVVDFPVPSPMRLRFDRRLQVATISVMQRGVIIVRAIGRARRFRFPDGFASMALLREPLQHARISFALVCRQRMPVTVENDQFEGLFQLGEPPPQIEGHRRRDLGVRTAMHDQ